MMLACRSPIDSFQALKSLVTDKNLKQIVVVSDKVFETLVRRDMLIWRPQFQDFYYQDTQTVIRI
jgi:hypothetical protein